jgi:hypothetical protein
MNGLHHRWKRPSHAQVSAIMCTLEKIADTSVEYSAMEITISKPLLLSQKATIHRSTLLNY